ncbi:ABC transporter substrate-binding protein [uncultured Dysosmobacter sp.]|uniref:ABC transporter substrate-binding protein n=1 Tax=uncultured Dysosmobacter sp. TaxID=2591384 RepID=UPI00261B8D4B|nr:PhnD/SsuA/transferrin family substrate-binding protein [uncultured Dysosmobacter sp.]
MKLFKKYMALVLALVLALSLAGCGGQKEEPQVAPVGPMERMTLRASALKGPTAMGLVKLMSDVDGGEPVSNNDYAFTLAASADEVTPLLIKGELDMACVPANLASVLYNKTEGEIVVLAVNTLGVLYIVENGSAVQSMADLKGKTIVAAGKGSTPEYALRYLLAENGVDPDKDVTIDWKSEHSECVAALASGAATVALLPQPFVTVAQSKIDGLRMAIDLNAEWDALDNGSGLITGVVVARKAVLEESDAMLETWLNGVAPSWDKGGPVDCFLEDYEASVAWVHENTAGAAQLIGEYGIVDAAVAEKALPYCNIVCIAGEEMREKLSGYLQVLFEADPASVGGKLPGGDFYYSV